MNNTAYVNLPYTTQLISQRPYLLIFIMVFLSLPLLTFMPWWMLLYISSVIVIRLKTPPESLVRFKYILHPLIIILLIGLIYVQFKQIVYAPFLLNSLAAFYWLKLIETRTLRDIEVIFLTGFYVMFAACIAHPQIWMFGFVILAVFANFYLYIKTNYPYYTLQGFSLNSLILILIAISISFILFFIFPRIVDPFWRTPLRLSTHIGFSETMGLSNLLEQTDNDATVMRVQMNASHPGFLYWQGLRLSFFDGRIWRISPWLRENFEPLPPIDLSKEKADYEILLEPLEKKWLFYLQKPGSSLPVLKFMPQLGLTKLSGRPIYQRFSYALRHADNQKEMVPASELQQNVWLPKKGNQKLREWANHQYAINQHNPQAFVNFLAFHIAHNPYWYKLKPTSVGNDSNQYERFWFQTREGFCEYYAGTIAYILRAVGIPALINLGYFGGEYNPYANYYTIKARHAHAWVSYWQEDVGWVRFDPTLFVDKSRIDPEILRQAEADALIQAETSTQNLSWFNKLKFSVQSIGFFLDRWLLFYNPEQQKELLSKVGFSHISSSTLLQLSIFILILFLGAGGLYFLFASKWQVRLHSRVEYRILRSIFSKCNVQLNAYQSLRRNCLNLIDRNPHLANVVQDFLNNYDALRLEKSYVENTQTRRLFKQLLKSFKKQIKQVLAKAS